MKRVKMQGVFTFLLAMLIFLSSTFRASAATLNEKQGLYKTSSGAVFGAYIGAKSTGKWIGTQTVSAKAITYKHVVVVKTLYMTTGGKTITKTAKYIGPYKTTTDYYLNTVPAIFKSGQYTGFAFLGTASCVYTASLVPEAKATTVNLYVKIPIQSC